MFDSGQGHHASPLRATRGAATQDRKGEACPGSRAKESEDGLCRFGLAVRPKLYRVFGFQISNSHGFAISPHIFRASLVLHIPPSESEGTGNAGRQMRPQPCVRNDKSTQA